jgi:hypothetical protein
MSFPIRRAGGDPQRARAAPVLITFLVGDDLSHFDRVVDLIRS